MKRFFLVLLAVVCAFPAVAQEEDAEGCTDPKVLTRMRGCVIGECSRKDYDAAELVVAADVQTQSVEGEVEIVHYGCPEAMSALMIARNAENALKTQGFSVVFSGTGNNDMPLRTMRKGGNWVSVETLDGGGYKLTVVRTTEMEQQMVANAAAWEEEINRTGQCSIYGILFDTAKATIKGEDSEKCLKEVVTLLKKNASWRMEIGGHTDNVGSKEANAKLSQQRADAVRAWLVANGVEASRLVARGYGDSRPVADNASEEGRAKNRRVGLVKL